MFLSRMYAQDVTPPQKMRLCVKTDCNNLVWAGDHYDAYRDGQTAIAARYWLTTWGADHVEFTGKTATAVDGVFPLEATFTGTIAPGGNSIAGGSFDWRVGYSSSGSGSYTLVWTGEAPRKANDGAQERRAAVSQSHRVNGILIPPGAADIFATYPDDVRAILLPEHELSATDAMRPCDAEKERRQDGAGTDEKDGMLSLEIGRYALRRGEFARGFCWINHSASAAATYQNPRAMVIMGILYMMGWYLPKDPQHAFRFFDGEFQTHDAWALYFVEQCYINGTGVAKNIPRAGQIDAYLMMHDDGQAIFRLVGSDDEGVMERAKALAADMNVRDHDHPPVCRMVPVAVTGTVRQECY